VLGEKDWGSSAREYERELRVTLAQAVPSLTRAHSHCVWRRQAKLGAGPS